MQDSLTLQLVMSAATMQEAISEYLIDALHKDGYQDIKHRHLAFLSALDCGENHASELARKLGVSRQMVAKNVKQLSQLGYLSQLPAKGQQKIIRFTQQGEALISRCRQQLAKLDSKLLKEVKQVDLLSTIKNMQTLNLELKPTKGSP